MVNVDCDGGGGEATLVGVGAGADVATATVGVGAGAGVATATVGVGVVVDDETMSVKTAVQPTLPIIIILPVAHVPPPNHPLHVDPGAGVASSGTSSPFG